MEQGVKYTGRNLSKNHGRPHLLSYSYEINMLLNSMKNCLGLCYKTPLINCPRHTHGDYSGSSSTINLVFRRLQHKITKIQRINQGIKNEGNWK